MSARLVASIVTSALLVTAGCSKKADPGGAADAAPAASESATVTSAKPTAEAPPKEKSPKELLEDHRRELLTLAEQEKYPDVCKGAPWFNSSICSWVAIRASGKGAERPDGEVFRAYFGKEHWKHVYGSIVGDPKEGFDIEVSVGGYRNHCLLTTTDSKFTSRGRFDLWVQEQAKAQEITLNSGETAHWVSLLEMPLARMLMGLAKSGGGLESVATAKDIMTRIAGYETYAEQKEVYPALPGASSAVPVPGTAPSAVTTSPSPSAANVPKTVSPPTTAPGSTKTPLKNPRARADCIAACVAKCADDGVCERACAGKCPG